eukprot:TRINITY_DN22931_c0_g2_i1.p1 TRINITY_DN22931_c0_g2~~TRINITY_DN22931_c0_g2_i1.p1  ORF type:complete len:1000 (-),score=202.59 TRINITY_DN22931_c0_g2_i1:140-3139(-)
MGSMAWESEDSNSKQLSFRERILDLAAEYETIVAERDRLLAQEEEQNMELVVPCKAIRKSALAFDTPAIVLEKPATAAALVPPAVPETDTSSLPLMTRFRSVESTVNVEDERVPSKGGSTNSGSPLNSSRESAMRRKSLFHGGARKSMMERFSGRASSHRSLLEEPSGANPRSSTHRISDASEATSLSYDNESDEDRRDGFELVVPNKPSAGHWRSSGARVSPALTQMLSEESEVLHRASKASRNSIMKPAERMIRRALNASGAQAHSRGLNGLIMDWLLGTPNGQWFLLFSVGVIIITLGAFLWRAFGDGNFFGDKDLNDSFWISWTLFFDPGTQTGIPPSEPLRVKVTALVLSFVGFCFNMSFLGMIVERVKEKLATWRKLHFRVALSGHILVLGWTDRTLFLLIELLEHARGRRVKIVILAMRDEHEMVQDIRSYFSSSAKLLRQIRNVIVIQGCPFDVDDLERVSASSAKEIVALSRKSPRSDLEMVRMMVALAALPKEVTGKVTVEVWDSDAEPVIEVILSRTDVVSSRDHVRSILCTMANKPIVSRTWLALLSKEESETFVVVGTQSLVGKDFGYAGRHFSSSSVIGIHRDGRLMIAPPNSATLQAGDKLLLIEHGKRARQSFLPLTQEKEEANWTSRGAWLDAFKASANSSDKDNAEMVVVGWSGDFLDFLASLDPLVAKGTRLHILSWLPVATREARLRDLELRNLVLRHHVGPRNSVDTLSKLPLQTAHSVFILADASGRGGEPSASGASAGDSIAGGRDACDDERSVDQAISTDSVCLTSMVTILGILDGLYGQPRSSSYPRIICEVLDPRTDSLLARNSALQEFALFFRSNHLESALFALATSDPLVFDATGEMLQCGPGGAIDVLSVGDVVESGAIPTSFVPDSEQRTSTESILNVKEPCPRISYWDMHDALRKKDNSILIGYLRAAELRGEMTMRSSDNNIRRFTFKRQGSFAETRGGLIPQIQRNKPVMWNLNDQLIVVRNPWLA